MAPILMFTHSRLSHNQHPVLNWSSQNHALRIKKADIRSYLWLGLFPAFIYPGFDCGSSESGIKVMYSKEESSDRRKLLRGWANNSSAATYLPYVRDGCSSAVYLRALQSTVYKLLTARQDRRMAPAESRGRPDRYSKRLQAHHFFSAHVVTHVNVFFPGSPPDSRTLGDERR